MLFAGSLSDNISFFDPQPDMPWLLQCAQMAAIHDDIQAMPMGYNTLVGDMGTCSAKPNTTAAAGNCEPSTTCGWTACRWPPSTPTTTPRARSATRPCSTSMATTSTPLVQADHLAATVVEIATGLDHGAVPALQQAVLAVVQAARLDPQFALGEQLAATVVQVSKQPGSHAYKQATVERPDIPNRLNREFATEHPNQVWCGDITYVWAQGRWHYLAAELDLPLAYNDDGSTTVTNEYGKQATYRFQVIQGIKRIVAIEGEPSPNCPSSNSTFTYDERGLLTQPRVRPGLPTAAAEGRPLAERLPARCQWQYPAAPP